LAGSTSVKRMAGIPAALLHKQRSITV
jgi:hypothetical protein